MDNIDEISKNSNSIDQIRQSTNNIYKNMFDILSNNNLVINSLHNLHTNFVILVNNKVTKEHYLEITKECCHNIDKLRELYITNADHHNDCLTKLYMKLNDFLESLQSTNNSKLDKSNISKKIINSDSENSESSDKKDTNPSKKKLNLQKKIIKSDSDSDD